MGDRISISFKNEYEESVTLFAHWEGMHLTSLVREYIQELNAELGLPGTKHMYPMDRREPKTVMVDFVRWLFSGTDNERIKSSWYFGKDENDGDNSDNGHHVFDLINGEFVY